MSSSVEAVPTTTPDDHQSTLHNIAKAFAWSSGGLWSTQLFTWVATFTVARLLTPADFGLVAVAYLCIGIIAEINGALIGLPVLNLRDLSEAQIGQLNTLAAMMGVAAFFLTCIFAKSIGLFFRMPRIPMILFWMGIIFLLTAVKTVPAALLQRDYQFKSLAAIEAFSYLAYALCTVGLALLGAGYWSLVAGMVCTAAVTSWLTLRARRHSFHWPTREGLRYPLRFGTHTLLTSLGWYIYSNSDFMAAGRMLGQTALGAYTFAWNLASAPVDKAAKLVNRVMPSYFAAAHNENAALRTYLLALSEVVCLVVLPMSVGMAIIADQFINVVVGAKWVSAVVPLRILLGYTLIRALTNITGPLLNAKKLTHFNMWINIAAAIIFPIGFLIGARWGTSGIAIMWVLQFPMLAAPLFHRTFREIELPWVTFLRTVWPAFSCGVLMAAALLVARAFLPVEWPEIARMALEIVLGICVYGCSLMLLHPRSVRRFYNIVRPPAHPAPSGQQCA